MERLGIGRKPVQGSANHHGANPKLAAGAGFMGTKNKSRSTKDLIGRSFPAPGIKDAKISGFREDLASGLQAAADRVKERCWRIFFSPVAWDFPAAASTEWRGCPPGRNRAPTGIGMGRDHPKAPFAP